MDKLLNTSFIFLLLVSVSSYLLADPIHCDMAAYKAQPGLAAEVKGDTLEIIWTGDKKNEFKVAFLIDKGVPKIAALAIRQHSTQWELLATNLTPEFRILSGHRRVTQQQTRPLEQLGIPLTTDILNKIKWDAFWDAPLFTLDVPPLSHQTSIPSRTPLIGQFGMPRSDVEIKRVNAEYQVTECEVRTNGARLEIIFRKARAGVFDGYLQFDVFKGSGLVRQMLVAKTKEESVAFKYDAGLSGLPLNASPRMVWRDLAGHWQRYLFGGPKNSQPIVVKSRNRLFSCELAGGSMAVFPPPHSFYWARESEQNLGYSWYRKDNDQRFSFGIRQAEQEEDPHFHQNFALYSARPDTWQRMPMFILLDPGSGEDVIDEALALTRDDRFKPLPGYKVMGYHYHVGLVERLRKIGSDQRINDIESMKSVGVDIFGVIDGVRGPARNDLGDAYLEALAEYYEAARTHSDKDFLLMPHDENSTNGRSYEMGAHHDLLLSKPVFWRNGRAEGKPFIEQHPKFGTVYNIGSPDDLMKLTELENAVISMPHPRSKGSTGYPESIKDSSYFLHENYFGLGYRWGMGIDASEIRLGEYRFLTLWDEVSNWMVERGRPLKYAMAISEARSDYGDRGKPPYDDIYGMSPVNYLKLDQVPTVDNMSPVIAALKQADFFVTSGEVLITSYAITGKGRQRVIVADVEWTFPLEFVEVVWGDGKQTDREVISTTDLGPFGRKRFEIPFDATKKKWVRFAAWDVATNGAMVQPMRLEF